ncbi:MAG: carboxypeptidase-like regulatory domain-containing protein, partial [Planctomycetota bacterium]
HRPEAPLRVDFMVRGKAPAFQRVTLGPCGKVLLVFDPVPGRTGIARSSDEQTLEWASVTAGGVVQDCCADPRGIASFEHVPATDAATAQGPHCDPALAVDVGPFQVRAGQTTRVVVRPPEPDAVFELEVVAPDGSPVPNASVCVLPAGVPPIMLRLLEKKYYPRAYVRRTDEDGRCRVLLPTENARQLASGWVAAAKHHLYRRKEVRGDGPIAPGTHHALRLELQHGTTLSGMVRREDHTPAPRVEVRWLRKEELPRTIAVGGALTDEEGRFRISGLEEGTFLLRATTDREISSDVEVPAGSEDVELVLSPESREVLAGRITVEEGLAIPRALIHAMSSRLGDYRASAQTSTRPDGSWKFQVPKGRCLLVVLPDKFGSFDNQQMGWFDSGRTDIELKLHLRAGPSGVVVGPDGVTVPLAYVAVRPGPAGQLRIEEAPGQFADRQGRFSFVGLSPGQDELVVAAGGLLPQIVALGEKTRDLKIALSAGQELRGVLRGVDSRPQSHTRLRIVPAGPKARAEESRYLERTGRASAFILDQLGRTVLTDDDGVFRFGSLTDGEYAVLLAEPLEGCALAPRPCRAGTSGVDLQLEQAVDLRCELFDESGAAWQGDTGGWFVRAESEGIEIATAPVLEHARATLRALPRCSLRLTLVGPPEFTAATRLAQSGAGEARLVVRRPADGDPR